MVQRKNVKDFDYKQTGIQSGVLLLILIIANYIIDRLLPIGHENFDAIHASDININASEAMRKTMSNTAIQNQLTSLQTAQPVETQDEPPYSEIEDEDFNTIFDTHKEPSASKHTGKMFDYNTQPGYTYMDPKKFRVGMDIQPPICLTEQPCATQPVLLDTSLGREFLPYSFIKASTQTGNSAQSKCSADTVYQA